MGQYNTGTVNTSSSSDIHGIGTAWNTDSNVEAGDLFKVIGSDVVYTVASVTGDSDLTLSAVYSGPDVSEVAYQITRDFTPNYNFPEVHSGDVDWPSIVTQAIRDIDNEMKINSDLVVIAQSDLLSIKSDLVVTDSDLTSVKSDLIVVESDLASAKSDLIVGLSDLASAKSDLIIFESDLTAVRSDLVADRSDLFNSFRDALTAFNAMDTANVSDIVVGIGEILTALSDALPYT